MKKYSGKADAKSSLSVIRKRTIKDILGNSGIVFCISLLNFCSSRKNRSRKINTAIIL